MQLFALKTCNTHSVYRLLPKRFVLEMFLLAVRVWLCYDLTSTFVCPSELELRQQRGVLSAGALVLTVRDRQEPLGSGGATLNALLVAAEHLSSRAGHTVSPQPLSVT